MTLILRCIQSNKPSIIGLFRSLHNCGHRSEEHHGEGVKDEIQSLNLEWCRLAKNRDEGIGSPSYGQNSDCTVGIVLMNTCVLP